MLLDLDIDDLEKAIEEALNNSSWQDGVGGTTWCNKVPLYVFNKLGFDIKGMTTNKKTGINYRWNGTTVGALGKWAAEASKDKKSGILEVDPALAQKLANAGIPVLVIGKQQNANGWKHAGIVEPSNAEYDADSGPAIAQLGAGDNKHVNASVWNTAGYNNMNEVSYYVAGNLN